MQYPTPAENNDKRRRVEDVPDVQKSLARRLHASFPSGMTPDPSTLQILGRHLRALMDDHDAPHAKCGRESWYVNGRFGGKDRNFSVFVNFARIAVVSDVKPAAEGEPITHAYTVNWAVVDHRHQKYYRFNEVDSRSPVLLSALIAKRQIRGETHMMQALTEQLAMDRTVLPERFTDDEANVATHKLRIGVGRNVWEQVAPAPGSSPNAPPEYRLHLEGQTFETGDTNLEEEVRAELELRLVPRYGPVLDGENGILRTGNFEEDQFVYFMPHVKVRVGAIRLTRASDGLEIGRDLAVSHGNFWIEHRFGGMLPETPEEAIFLRAHRKKLQADKMDTEEMCDRCMIRLFTEDQDSLCVTRFMQTPTGETRDLFSVVQCGRTKQGYYYDVPHGVRFEADTSESGSLYQSVATGVIYAKKWKLTSPLSDGKVAELTVTVDFPEQEFVSSYAQPSYWEGTVSVSGVVKTEDGQSTPVRGEGFLSSHGRALQSAVEQRFHVLHDAGVALMERADVAAFDSVEAVESGPAVAAMANISLIFQMQQRPLSDAHKVVLTGMLAAYGFIYHHPSQREKVVEALEWSYKRWATHFCRDPIDAKTLIIRAFMLSQLGAVMREKCHAYISSKAVALDIASSPESMRSAMSAAVDAEELADTAPPSTDVLHAPSAGIAVTQLKAFLDGEWEFVDSTGDISSVLLWQGVGVLWRNLISKTEPRLSIVVTNRPEVKGEYQVSIAAQTPVESVAHTYHLTGKAWDWHSSGRGQLTSRACVLGSGAQLFVETCQKDSPGVEHSFFSAENQGAVLVEKVLFYNTSTADKPVAFYTRKYKMVSDNKE